jgi:KUP system potassium uptake protein
MQQTADSGIADPGSATGSWSHRRTLALGALGIVFGDIGTSPLYALKECFHASHGIPINEASVIGILSLIFWSLTLVVSLKYIAFIMRADNNGEGGIMALLALTLRTEHRSSRRRWMLVGIGIFGAALFFGDGIITPAISVLSAIEGLKIAAPALGDYVVPLTIGVLIGLFLLQRHGTGSVGAWFGPVMLLWFATLGVLGVINIGSNFEVLQLVNPLWAIRFVLEHGLIALIVLGAVVLTITGGEALYADMGHFGRSPIRYAWFGVVLPALLLNYCGQGALLLRNPEAVENPFFLLAPDWMLLPLVTLATVAAVIASQAVISGVFSIARQAVQLGYLPRMEVCHTSTREIGQIYIPSLNWFLLACIILLVLTFRSSSNLASAYGIAVTLTMICDTVLAAVVAYKLWKWNIGGLALLIVPLLAIDLAFFTATSFKILQGGWFPMLIGLLVYAVMSTWKRGRKIMFKQLAAETMPLDLFVGSVGGGSVHEVPGTAVFMTSSLTNVPHALLHNMKHNKILHERNVLLTVATTDVPFVPDAQRLQIERIGDKFWTITGSYGFKEEPDIPALLALCREHDLAFEMMDTSFFLSRERIVSGVNFGMPRWREMLFSAMFRNAASASDFFHIPSNRVVELGSQVMV